MNNTPNFVGKAERVSGTVIHNSQQVARAKLELVYLLYRQTFLENTINNI